MIDSIVSHTDTSTIVLTKTFEQCTFNVPKDKLLEAFAVMSKICPHIQNDYEIEAMKDMEKMIDGSGWRMSNCNSKYAVCSTYPRWLVVPDAVTDTILIHAARFRVNHRLPVLSYLHQSSHAAILRSSQPYTGLTHKRSTQDEHLIRSACKLTGKLTIVDARPPASALANAIQGKGSENPEHYQLDCNKIHLHLPNMHAVREMAIARGSGDPSAWDKSVKKLIDGAVTIADCIRNGRTVLIHCSDGWDRTPQLTCLAMLLLSPETYLASKDHFMLLIYREWLLMGHKFASRHGHQFSLHNKSSNNDYTECSPIFMQFLHAAKAMTGDALDGELMDSLLLDSYNANGMFAGDCDRERQVDK